MKQHNMRQRKKIIRNRWEQVMAFAEANWKKNTPAWDALISHRDNDLGDVDMGLAFIVRRLPAVRGTNVFFEYYPWKCPKRNW